MTASPVARQTPQLAALTGRYASDGPSRVACTEGEGVPYPAGAPGFAYDPIGDASAAGSPHDVGSLCYTAPSHALVLLLRRRTWAHCNGVRTLLNALIRRISRFGIGRHPEVVS